MNYRLILKQHRTSNNKFHNMYWQGKSESNSNYSQLIPEYVCLRDLKFRVSNINNLQVNIF